QHSRPEQLSRFFHALAVSASLLTSSVGLPAFADELSDNTFTSKRVNTLKKSNLIVESFFQQKELTGRVTDVDGKGIEGVSVKVKGSAAGTSTDSSGQYSLTASNNDKTLVFSNIGYLSQEVANASNG